MANLEKAELRWSTEISDSKKSGTIKCQFNPAELSISKNVTWSAPSASTSAAKENAPASLPNWNAPKIAFGGGGSAKYNLSLFFDATGDKDVADVRYYTQELMRLTLRGAGGTKSTTQNAVPPTVTFVWGKICLFKAVVESVSVQYIMFAGDGTPIRAKASVSLIQNDPEEDISVAQNPTSRSDPRKTYMARSGQRLDQIAYEEYKDARYWRLLAESNNMDDPFTLSDGQILVIHPLD